MILIPNSNTKNYSKIFPVYTEVGVSTVFLECIVVVVVLLSLRIAQNIFDLLHSS
jgi:hypothetical protein